MDPADFEIVPPKWGGGLTRPKAVNVKSDASQTPDMSAFLTMFGIFEETFIPQGAKKRPTTVKKRGILYAKPGNSIDKSGEYIWRDLTGKGGLYRFCGKRIALRPFGNSISMRLPDNTFIKITTQTLLQPQWQRTEFDEVHRQLMENTEYAKSFNAWNNEVPRKTPSSGPGQGGQ